PTARSRVASRCRATATRSALVAARKCGHSPAFLPLAKSRPLLGRARVRPYWKVASMTPPLWTPRDGAAGLRGGLLSGIDRRTFLRGAALGAAGLAGAALLGCGDEEGEASPAGASTPGANGANGAAGGLEK